MSNFNFTLSTLEIQCQKNQEKFYLLGSDKTVFTLGYLNKTQTIQHVTVVFESIGIDKTGNEIELPTLFQFTKQTGEFSINTNNQNDLGDYKLGLKISNNALPNYKVRCELLVKVIYNHIFYGDFINDQTISCYELVNIKVPEFTDYFGKKAVLQLDLDDTSSFLKFYPTISQIKMRSANYSLTLSEHVGSYKIKYKLTDSQGNSLDFSFQITVTCLQVSIPKVQVAQRPYMSSLDPPKPIIKSISPIGVVRIEFTKILLVPNYDLFPEFKEPSMMRPILNATDSINSDVTVSGLRLLEERKVTSRRQPKTDEEIEQEAISIINRGVVVLNNTDYPVVQLRLEAGIETDPKLLIFTYECIKFKPTYMEFQTNYTKPDQISVRQAKERLNVEFNGPWYFRTSNDEAFSPNLSIKVEKQIPQQIDIQVGMALTKAANTMSNASKGVLVINLVFSGALQQMLAAMKKMQIMIHLLLMDINIPSNVSIFFNSFLKLVTYNLINLEPMTRKFFKLYDDKAFSQEFEDLGYGSQFSVINLGSVFLGILAIPPVLVIVFVCKPLNKFKYVEKLRHFLKRRFIWDGIISIFNENYILIVISCFINLIFYKNVYDKGEVFSFSVAFAFLIVVIAYPIFVIVLLNKKYRSLGKYNMRVKYGSLYLGFKYNQGKLQVLEPFFSALRRLSMVAAMIFLKGLPVFQLMVCVYLWIATIILNGYLMFQNPRDFIMDQTNEFFIVVLLYHMICFADLVASQTTRGYIGWSMVATMCLNVCFNFSVILNDSSRDYIQQVKFWWLRRKNRLLKAKIQNFEENRQRIKQENLENLQKNAEEKVKEEPKYNLLNVNKKKIDEQAESFSQRKREEIKRMWENDNDEEQTSHSIETVLKTNLRKNNQKHGPRARSDQNPLGMNQEDFEPEVQAEEQNFWIKNQRQLVRLPYYYDYQDENIDSDEEQKEGWIESEGNQISGNTNIKRNQEPQTMQIYEQMGDFDDPYVHLARVQRRQRMLINQVASPLTQQKRFDQLWNHDVAKTKSNKKDHLKKNKNKKKINLNDL